MRSARRWRTTSTWDHAALTASRLMAIWLRRPTYMPPKIKARTIRITTRTRPAFMGFSFAKSEILFPEALPFAFGDQGVEGPDDGLDGFEILAEVAGHFGRRMIVPEGLA